MKNVFVLLFSLVAVFAAPSFGQIYSAESNGKTVTWNDDESTIRLALVSDGITGDEWVSRLEMSGTPLNEEVKAILRSEAFVPTHDTIAIGIIKGEKIADPYRTDPFIRNKAREDYYFKPLTLEAAVLIKYYLSEKIMKKMGFDWIAAMTEPIPPTYNTENVLLVATDSHLGIAEADSGRKWKRQSGFAFIWYN